MNWYLVVKYLHIVAVAVTIGGMFARQLVRAYARKSDDVRLVASITRAALRIDRLMVIPWSNIMILMGIGLALMMKWPIFGFLQGASQNWLLISNLLLVVLIGLIAVVFVPYNRKLEVDLQHALDEGSVTPALSALLNEPRNRIAHMVEEVVVLVIAALMVLKPF